MSGDESRRALRTFPGANHLWLVAGSGWGAEALSDSQIQLLPLENVTAYSTLGLSPHILMSPSNANQIRLELLVLVRRGNFDKFIPSIFQQLADETPEGGRALLRGDLIGSRGVLDPDTSLEAFYVYSPVYQPDEFAVCKSPEVSIVIAWLIPLFAEEANFALTHGRQALEELLIEHDPDVGDWQRAPLPVH